MRRRDFLAGTAAVLAFPGGLAADPPAFRPAPRPLRRVGVLSDAIAAARLGEGAVVAFAVRDAGTGALLDSADGDAAMAPASTLKAVTALYALDRLGAGYRFATSVVEQGDTLVLVGGGDPVLDTDGLAALARDLVASGVTAPARFAVWGGALPRLEELEPGQADHLAYNPSLSGMILNFNRVHFGWRQGAQGPSLSMEARADHASPRAWTVGAAPVDRRAPLFQHSADERGEHWTVARGALRGSGSRWLPVRLPELYAGDVFQTLCRAEGLVLPRPEVATTAPMGREVVRRWSPPLQQILRGMLDHSTNLTAEVVGLTASGAGSLATSAAAMGGWLRGLGIGGDFIFADHSGLSAGSRISAASLSAVMAGPGLAAGLEGLMIEVPALDAEGRKRASPVAVRAKTGTLNFVSNLAGIARAPGGGPPLAFAILIADEGRRARTEGMELPEGVIGWTQRAKALQSVLVEDFAARFG